MECRGSATPDPPSPQPSPGGRGSAAHPRRLPEGEGDRLMPINVWDYRPEYAEEHDEIMAAVERVFRSGRLILGETVREVAQRRGLKVLEDCAQSHGALRHGVKAGAMSDAAAFSFYPTKILGGYGDGGMVVTDDAEVAAHLRRLRMYGMEREYYSE